MKPPIPQPSITAEPWPTPAITPSSTLLSPDNINKVQQLAQFGMGTISDAALSADGTLLVVGSTTGIHFYDPDTLKLTRVISTERPVGQVALSRDGRRLMALEWWQQGLRILDTTTGKVVQTFDVWTGPWSRASISPDGLTVALADRLTMMQQNCGM